MWIVSFFLSRGIELDFSTFIALNIGKIWSQITSFFHIWEVKERLLRCDFGDGDSKVEFVEQLFDYGGLQENYLGLCLGSERNS